jgi:putative membrane protein
MHIPTLPVKKIACGAVLSLIGSLALNNIAAAEPSSYDKTFMTKAADAGATEIAASKVAETKAGDEKVKSFAQTMVGDHTKVADELKQLATSKNVTLSDAPSKPHAEKIAKLDKLEGKKFDKEYAKTIGVAAHKDAVKLFSDASKKASDPDVKAFAAKNLPALEHHLQMATELNSTVK